MSIEKLMQDALKNQTPVRLRDGRKAYVVADMRAMSTRLGHGCKSIVGRDFCLVARGCSDDAFTLATYPNGRYWDRCQKELDVVGPWLEFEHWDALRPEFKYMAMDADGCWYAYQGKPGFRGTGWMYSPSKTSMLMLAFAGIPAISKEMCAHSLIKRPD